MNRIDVTYPLTVSDYRRASYYGLAIRQYKTLRFLIILIGFAAASIFTAVLWNKGTELATILVCVCAIWLLSIFSSMERGIRRYLKTPENMIGCEYKITLESHRIEIRVPERKVNYSVKINDLVAVFELNGLFMIYISAQDAYLLPFRVLTKEQQETLKDVFRRHLGERFNENKKLSFKHK